MDNNKKLNEKNNSQSYSIIKVTSGYIIHQIKAKIPN